MLHFHFRYLANDMEEDDEDVKYDIFPWALGEKWRSRYVYFFKKREKLWELIDYRAVVSKKCCEEVSRSMQKSCFFLNITHIFYQLQIKILIFIVFHLI